MIGSRILHGICHSRLQLAMTWSNQKSYRLHSSGILPYQRCQQEKKNRCVDASENFQQTQGPSCPCLLFLPNSLFLFWWLRFFMALTLAFLCSAWSISDLLYFAGYLLSSPWVGPGLPAPGDLPQIHWGQVDSRTLLLKYILSLFWHRSVTGHTKGVVCSQPFPLLNKHLETCPGREAWVGGYFGYNFKEHFEPESSDMKVQGESCSMPPGPVIHWLSNAKSNCKFPHLPSGG